MKGTTNLSYNTTYSITIGTGVEDLAGNGLVNAYSWEFTTAEEAEIVQPPVSNDYLWLVILLIIIVTLLCLWIFYQHIKERKEEGKMD